MNPSKSIYHLALVTLQAETAHGIHSGESDLVQDVVLLRDVNGLPAIPGTSLAGALRHLFSNQCGPELTDRVFGFAGNDDGHSSGVQIGWALAHDSQNIVREGIREDAGDDPLLSVLARAHPLVRQRVRLDARGTAEDTGKFDVSLIPAGVRYSALLGFWSDGSDEDENAWKTLLALLHSKDLRLGHGTRSGAGAFSLIALHRESWDLETPQGHQGYMRRPRTRLNARQLPVADPEHAETGLSVTLALKSEAGWRIGGGDVPVGFDDNDPDMLPQTEWCIHWHNDKAHISERLGLLPASAVKGALLHRFAFHYRCLSSNWVDGDGPESPHEEAAVKELFGYAGDQEDEGQAGLVVIDDIYLDNMKTATQMHNRIDQFTGGVMSGALFEEGLLWQTPITLSIHLQQGTRLDSLSAPHRQAFKRALDDLCEGRLPLGSGGSRGQGTFVAQELPHWSDGGVWVGQQEQG